MWRLCLVLVIVVTACEAQVEEVEDAGNETFCMADHPASFEGGWPGFFKYISNSIAYPHHGRHELADDGKVFIEFIIERDGTVSNVKVLKGIGPPFDDEAVRIISVSPRWTPATHEGKTVRQRMVVPIRICYG